MLKWVEFEDGKSGTIEIPHDGPLVRNPDFKRGLDDRYLIPCEWTQEKMERFAETVVRNESGVKSLEDIPYPASPVLYQIPHISEDGTATMCPNFCYRQEDCVGRTSCPHNPCCTS